MLVERSEKDDYVVEKGLVVDTLAGEEEFSVKNYVNLHRDHGDFPDLWDYLSYSQEQFLDDDAIFKQFEVTLCETFLFYLQDIIDFLANYWVNVDNSDGVADAVLQWFVGYLKSYRFGGKGADEKIAGFLVEFLFEGRRVDVSNSDIFPHLFGVEDVSFSYFVREMKKHSNPEILNNNRIGRITMGVFYMIVMLLFAPNHVNFSAGKKEYIVGKAKVFDLLLVENDYLGSAVELKAFLDDCKRNLQLEIFEDAEFLLLVKKFEKFFDKIDEVNDGVENAWSVTEKELLDSLVRQIVKAIAQSI